MRRTVPNAKQLRPFENETSLVDTFTKPPKKASRGILLKNIIE